MVSTQAFVSKIFRPIIFSAVKKVSCSVIEKIFFSQGSFPQSNNFFTVEEIFHSRRNFPQLRTFVFYKKVLSTTKDILHKEMKEIFYKQKSFQQTNIFKTK